MKCKKCGVNATHSQLQLCDVCYKVYKHINHLDYARTNKEPKQNNFKTIRDACLDRIKQKYKT